MNSVYKVDRSPVHTIFENGPFSLGEHKYTYSKFLKMKVYDMKYESLKWRTLHSSMLVQCSKGIQRHKQQNRNANEYCKMQPVAHVKLNLD